MALTVGLSIYILPRKSFSESENRILAEPPQLSARAVGNGSFFKALSSFYSDRIPLRTQLIRIKAVCELCLGKAQNNGVLFCSDGTLTDSCEYEELTLLHSNLQGIKAFAEKYGAECVLVPRSIDVRTSAARFGRSEAAERSLGVPRSYSLGNDDLLKALRTADRGGDEVYYATDHHLNARGAYILYSELVTSLGLEPYPENSFEPTQVSDSFLGSVYSSAGMLPVSYDSVTLYRYDGDGDVTVHCRDRGCTQSKLYELSALEKKDKYQVFLGGNHGMLDITTSGTSKPRMLLIKDSFANAVIPLLARHFELTVIDPRYISAPLSSLADANDFEHTVILCGIDTLATTRLRLD